LSPLRLRVCGVAFGRTRGKFSPAPSRMNTPAAFLRLACLALIAIASFVVALPAQTPPPPAKRLPPAGIAIAPDARAELTAGAAALRQEIDAVAGALTGNPRLLALLPDVEVLHKAVDWALRYDEFFDAKQIPVARRMLQLGRERAAHLRGGQAPWLEATGPVLRGYRSTLDGSVQPYGLIVPENLPRPATGTPLMVWLLGRGEKRTELAFLAEREAGPPQLTPKAMITLVPYGRFCNATKFAGEVDVMEALAAVRAQYRIDANRTIVAGFSMGGASTWHLATHHPGLWAAAAPGAGFAETAVYAKVFAPGKPERTPWEQTLWRWYDATGYAANLRHVPTIAYSGELDPQKQAADIMAQALAAEGLPLEHLIGPQTAHKYHPETKVTLTGKLEALVARGREEWPAEDHFTTYTPRYSRSRRILIGELEEVWTRADVHVRFPAAGQLEATTKNVAAFSVRLEQAARLVAKLDGQDVTVAKFDPGSWFVKQDGRWTWQSEAEAARRWRNGARKIPGLSGPINDAFMEPFLFVRPTGKPLNPTVGAWVEAELKHATKLWRDLFRAELVIKDDTAVTMDDLAQRNLVLWGDATSNRLIAKLLSGGKLPLTWDATQLTFRGQRYDAAHHAPVLVLPNPLSTQRRYLVLNSGIDFRDEAYGTNSLQTPKLPDFAIVDLREPPGARWPGRIVEAGFFNAAWK
jgi:pimeloyl-ACP methyl ester carboxylesterase